MRIATYNVWNESKNIENRTEQIIEEINTIDADIIGLQEVTQALYNILTEKLSYVYHECFMYRDEEEGLAFFCKYPIQQKFFLNTSDEYTYSQSLNVLFQAGDLTFSVTNLHLPWDSILEKEKQIVSIDRFIHSQKGEADFFIMLGDFNCTLISSVHNYLLGEQSLLGHESKPYWFDLASVHAALNNIPEQPTLDFSKNPRWGGKNTTAIPVVYDRILVMENFDNQVLNNVDIFGTAISPVTKLSASDHYGVVADIDFSL